MVNSIFVLSILSTAFPIPGWRKIGLSVHLSERQIVDKVSSVVFTPQAASSCV